MQEQESVERTDDELLSAHINGKLSGVETDALIDRLGREPYLATKLEIMSASDLAEDTVLSKVYEDPRLP